MLQQLMKTLTAYVFGRRAISNVGKKNIDPTHNSSTHAKNMPPHSLNYYVPFTACK